MNDLSKISSTDLGLERRMPFPFEGVDVNFCWNPQCVSLGIHTKSEPDRRIQLLTDRPGRDYRSTARLLLLATLRSVDSYFNKFRSNLRFVARPQVSDTSDRKAWDKYYLYKPEIMVKLTEIYRFHHNWVGYGSKETPVMKLGLARGRIYERDLL